MTRHGLKPPDPAIIALRATQTFAPVIAIARKRCAKALTRCSKPSAQTPKWVWLMPSAPPPSRAKPIVLTGRNPKSP